jgi:hypothetical protein
MLVSMRFVGTVRTLMPLVFALTAARCAPPVQDGPQSIHATSKGLTIDGQYAAVALDEVKHIAIEHGKLVLHGENGTATVDLPADAGEPKTSDQWALVTESKNGNRRALTFTHEQSLEDFTFEVPASDAELHYGTLAGRSGHDLLVFAWGIHARSYWGYVSITR